MGTMVQEANPASRTAALGFRLLDGIQPMISTVTTAIGDVLAVDESITVNGGYTTVKQVIAGDLTGMGFFGVSLDAITSTNTTGRFLFIGYASQALMVAATAAGAELTPTAASRALTATASGQKVTGKCITATGAAGLTDIFWDGINGFGCLA